MMPAVEVTGTDELIKALAKKEGDVQKALARACMMIGQEIADEAKGLVNNRTGMLANSYHASRPQIEDNTVSVKVGTNLEYAPYIEFGTGYAGENDLYNILYPVDGLAFTSKESWRYQDVDGNWHTGRPQPAQAPLRRALAAKEDIVQDAVETALEGAL